MFTYALGLVSGVLLALIVRAVARDERQRRGLEAQGGGPYRTAVVLHGRVPDDRQTAACPSCGEPMVVLIQEATSA